MTLEAMCDAAFVRTREACEGRDILAVQDTTVTRSSGGGGDYLHAMIAVDARDGAVPGALDATFCERDTGQRATRHARAFEDKESHRWLAATERAGEIAGAGRITMVADREADIFDLFARRPQNVELIVRANHNRTLEGGDKIAEWIAAMPRLGTTLLTLPKSPGRAARDARLSIRFGQATMKPPKRLEKTTSAPVTLTYIDLREETPPDGVKPVHWRLLTSYDIINVTDALDVAERYGRCLRPLTDAFDAADQPLLEALSADLEGKTDRQKNPHPKGSLAFASWVCARLGGWTGYYGKPGPIVILSGWTEFQSIKHGAYIAESIHHRAS